MFKKLCESILESPPPSYERLESKLQRWKSSALKAHSKDVIKIVDSMIKDVEDRIDKGPMQMSFAFFAHNNMIKPWHATNSFQRMYDVRDFVCIQDLIENEYFQNEIIDLFNAKTGSVLKVKTGVKDIYQTNNSIVTDHLTQKDVKYVRFILDLGLDKLEC
jgi:hypothetical protein